MSEQALAASCTPAIRDLHQMSVTICFINLFMHLFIRVFFILFYLIIRYINQQPQNAEGVKVFQLKLFIHYYYGCNHSVVLNVPAIDYHSVLQMFAKHFNIPEINVYSYVSSAFQPP